MKSNVKPDYHYFLKTTSNPSVSPDGTFVAATIQETPKGSVEPTSDIWVYDTGEANEARQLTRTGTASKPTWSSDGAQLIFLDEDSNGTKQIFKMEVAGRDAEQVTSANANIDAYAWSPDGTKLAYRGLVLGPDELALSDAPENTPQIRVARRIRYQQDGVGWRGDSFYHLFVMDTATGVVTQITDGEGDDGPPVWSPDGSQIAYITDAVDDRDTRSHTELRVCGFDGSDNESWSDGLFMAESIAWSPNGTQIAVSGSPNPGEAGGYGLTAQSYIYILEPGKAPRVITKDSIRPHANGTGFPVTADSPPIQWDANGITFGADSKGQSFVCRADPETRELLSVGGERSITEISFSLGGDDIATIMTDTDSFSEIEIFSAESMESRWKSSINSDFFSSHEVASLEKFTFERAGMGVEVRVWLPPKFDPEKKYPLLLDVHGGPHSSFFDAFYPIHQVGAGAGYVVVAPNPRGSSTYGAASIEAVHGDWGGEDFQDVMQAMEEVASRDYIDENKVVIHGSSYGGFMSSWAVGHTDRFRAAVIAAPVTNLSSFYGTSDIGVNFSETQLGGERFDKFADYQAHSPLTFARDVNTPVLLLHGEDDIRVPIEQAEQYFVALKRHGKEVEFCRLPGTSHGIFRARNPAIREYYFTRMIEWFERHLA